MLKAFHNDDRLVVEPKGFYCNMKRLTDLGVDWATLSDEVKYFAKSSFDENTIARWSKKKARK